MWWKVLSVETGQKEVWKRPWNNLLNFLATNVMKKLKPWINYDVMREIIIINSSLNKGISVSRKIGAGASCWWYKWNMWCSYGRRWEISLFILWTKHWKRESSDWACLRKCYEWHKISTSFLLPIGLSFPISPKPSITTKMWTLGMASKLWNIYGRMCPAGAKICCRRTF